MNPETRSRFTCKLRVARGAKVALIVPTITLRNVRTREYILAAVFGQPSDDVVALGRLLQVFNASGATTDVGGIDSERIGLKAAARQAELTTGSLGLFRELIDRAGEL